MEPSGGGGAGGYFQVNACFEEAWDVCGGGVGGNMGRGAGAGAIKGGVPGVPSGTSGGYVGVCLLRRASAGHWVGVEGGGGEDILTITAHGITPPHYSEDQGGPQHTPKKCR